MNQSPVVRELFSDVSPLGKVMYDDKLLHLHCDRRSGAKGLAALPNRQYADKTWFESLVMSDLARQFETLHKLFHEAYLGGIGSCLSSARCLTGLYIEDHCLGVALDDLHHLHFFAPEFGCQAPEIMAKG